jgi:hypothetical protein
MFCAICLDYTKEHLHIKKFCEDNKIVFFPTTFETFTEDDEHLQVLFTWILMGKIKKEKNGNNTNEKRTVDKCGFKQDYQIANVKKSILPPRRKKYSL